MILFFTRIIAVISSRASEPAFFATFCTIPITTCIPTDYHFRYSQQLLPVPPKAANEGARSYFWGAKKQLLALSKTAFCMQNLSRRREKNREMAWKKHENMPSFYMQSVQKGEKAYSDGRIAVPDDGILQHRQHFPMARKYHCCSRNDTFIASRSTEKSTSPLQPHPPYTYFRASRSTEKSRKNL